MKDTLYVLIMVNKLDWGITYVIAATNSHSLSASRFFFPFLYN